MRFTITSYTLLIGLVSLLAAHPVQSKGYYLPPDIVPGDSYHSSNKQVKAYKTRLDEWTSSQKMPKTHSWKHFFKDKQACMLCVEVFELSIWETKFNKPKYKKYYTKYKKHSFATVKKILNGGIDETKLASKAGAILDKCTLVSSYSPRDPQVGELLKLALALQSLDKQLQNKKIDSHHLRERKTEILKKINVLVNERI